MRSFESGAIRDDDEGKLSFLRFFSPRVLRRRAEYMQEHSVQADGAKRAPDNWKKGIPIPAYMDSLVRHVQELSELWELAGPDGSNYWNLPHFEDTLCAIMFNAEGLLYELGKVRYEGSHPVSELPEDPKAEAG